MKRTWAIAATSLLAVSLTDAQQTTQPGPSPQGNLQKTEGIVHVVGKDVSAPEFLPADFPLPDTSNCATKVSGDAVLSFLVDPDGTPRSIAFEEGVGNGLDGLAYKILSADRFKPATHGGVTVEVPMTAELSLDACFQQTPAPNGETRVEMKLLRQPKQKFKAMPSERVELEFAQLQSTTKDANEASDSKRAKVTPPRPLNSVAAVYSDEARQKKISGICLVSLIVDNDGKARNVRVIRPLGYGLDQNAVQAARRYRFTPAMKSGNPVPVMITAEVNFRLY